MCFVQASSLKLLLLDERKVCLTMSCLTRVWIMQVSLSAVAGQRQRPTGCFYQENKKTNKATQIADKPGNTNSYIPTNE